jgi:uncharacterized protein (TIGR02145 family)
MKLRIFTTFIGFAILLCALGQKSPMELTYTSISNASYVRLDSIQVMNKSLGIDTVLYYPDTVLVLDYPVGIREPAIENQSLRVFQNYPNPVTGQTSIKVYVPARKRVNILISDIQGRPVISSEHWLDEGYHLFTFKPGNAGLYLFLAGYENQWSGIRILSSSKAEHMLTTLEYAGTGESTAGLLKVQSVRGFLYRPGDKLLHIGFSNGIESGISDSPITSRTYTFQYAFNIPCPGTPTVTYAEKVYNTVQIFSQCWFKENINVGNMGSKESQDSTTIRKYCYLDLETNCDIYGGIYKWDEAMQHSTAEGAQGICPSGWHIPTDDEWKVLEGAADSQYPVGDPIWDQIGVRGFDAGYNLKSATGWAAGGNGSDLFGFSGLPGGFLDYDGAYHGITNWSFWYTSTIMDDLGDRYIRRFNASEPGSDYAGSWLILGHSIRCLRNN